MGWICSCSSCRTLKNWVTGVGSTPRSSVGEHGQSEQQIEMSYDDELVLMVSLETMWGKVAEIFRRFSSFKKYFGKIVDSSSTGGEEFFAGPVWMEEKKNLSY